MADDTTLLGGGGGEPHDAGNAGAGADIQDAQTQQQDNQLTAIFGDYANDPSIQKFKDPKDLAKSYIELQKMVGKNRIPVPERPEEFDQVLQKLGVPDDPSKYPDFEDAEVIFGGKEGFEEFKKFAHRAKLLPQQYEEAYNAFREIISQEAQMTQAERQQMAQEALIQLQKEFGDEYEQKVKLADRLFRSFPEDVKQAIYEAGLDVNPNFVKILATMAENYKEDSFIVSDYTPAEAKSELESILNNKDHPYWNRNHPEHDAAVDKVDKLYKIVYG